MRTSARKDQAGAIVFYEPGSALAISRFSGAVTAGDLERAQSELLDICSGRKVRALIVDARESQASYTPAEMIESVETSLEHLALYRCAVVVRAERADLFPQLDSAARPFGVRVRAFNGMEEARAWALS